MVGALGAAAARCGIVRVDDSGRRRVCREPVGHTGEHADQAYTWEAPAAPVAVVEGPVEPGQPVTVLCGWYVLCDRPAAGVVRHPVLEWLPVCQRCADSHGLELVPAEWVADEPEVAP